MFRTIFRKATHLNYRYNINHLEIYTKCFILIFFYILKFIALIFYFTRFMFRNIFCNIAIFYRSISRIFSKYYGVISVFIYSYLCCPLICNFVINFLFSSIKTLQPWLKIFWLLLPQAWDSLGAPGPAMTSPK